MSAFEANGKVEEGLLSIGNYIPLRDEAGNHYNGKVLTVGDDIVKLDFNHPLAGKALVFSVVINNIREASAEELITGVPAENKQSEDGCCSTDGDAGAGHSCG